MGTGNSGFILVCSGMVFLMTPALAFFMVDWKGEKYLEHNDDGDLHHGTSFSSVGGGWVFAFFQWYRCLYRQHR